MAFKKKLYKFRPKDQPQEIETLHTKRQKKSISVTPTSIERDVRQQLADKISSTYMGLWLLVPEHLRLGSWNLLKAWSGSSHSTVLEGRLALQMIHESALCVNGVRKKRTLHQKGFEVLNGLPFVASDSSIHYLLDRHTTQQAHTLQIALGKIRQAQHHYPGEFILIDPHRIQTWSKRNMPSRKDNSSKPARKTAQTFFAIDAQSCQPLSFGMGSASVTVNQATLPLIKRLDEILPNPALLIADREHCTLEILNHLSEHPKFSILVPTPRWPSVKRQIKAMEFTPLWAGYAVAEGTYKLAYHDFPFRLIVQRTGERIEEYDFRPFITTSFRPAEELMSLVFPIRWNIEEFFNIQSALGWSRASTLNLNIRFGKLSLVLITQSLIAQMKEKLPQSMKSWNAQSIAERIFKGIDGDLRVKDETLLVTFYNAPTFIKAHYENLPQRLYSEGVDPRIPWLYDFKLDFRFR